MMNIRVLTIEDRVLIKEIALLHQKAFPGFFLTQLGLPFLRTLYNSYLDDINSGIIVAEDGNEVIGFIAYSNDYPCFFRNLIRHRIIQFGWYAFLAFLRHPTFANRLFAAFKKSDSVVKTESYVELASICTDPENEDKGIGSALISYLKNSVDFDKYMFISLETDAEHNEKANHFYQKNGFVKEREYITPEGRKMIEYRYRKEDSLA